MILIRSRYDRFITVSARRQSLKRLKTDTGWLTPLLVQSLHAVWRWRNLAATCMRLVSLSTASLSASTTTSGTFGLLYQPDGMTQVMHTRPGQPRLASAHH